MIKGKDIVLSMAGTPMAVATNASIELVQEAEEYTPMPGTLADDGWRHFRPGALSWSISHDGLVCDSSEYSGTTPKVDVEDLISAIYSGDSDVTLSLAMPIHYYAFKNGNTTYYTTSYFNSGLREGSKAYSISGNVVTEVGDITYVSTINSTIRVNGVTYSRSENDDVVISHTLSGTARLSEISVVAQVKSLAKLSAKFDCNNFPSIS